MTTDSENASVLSGASTHHITCERAESFLDRLPDGCVSLMTLDFPYYGVKSDSWDNAWPTSEAFLEWMGGVLSQCRRALAQNGSICVFASPQMAWCVEGKVREHFSVLTNIRWQKPPHSTKAEMFRKEDLRAPFPASETIVFAEQIGSNAIALGESRYGAKCDELRGFVFEPLRAYFDVERKRSGLRSEQIQAGMFARTGARYVFDRHTFSQSQWNLPTAEQYAAARNLFDAEGNPEGAPYLRAQYEELRAQYEELRAQYEELRAQYEELRRPFAVSSDVPYTDVWTYPTVNTYPGKHPCEKPENMARDMVRASSRPGGIVADFFCGSGAFLAAAVAEGRRAIGCDMDPHWAEQARRRCDATKSTGRIVRTALPSKTDGQLDLFGS